MRPGRSGSTLGIVVLLTALAAVCCSGSNHATGVLGSPTTTVPSPTSVPPRLASGPAGVFTGDWYSHGRGLVIDGSGAGILEWRVYRWCSEEPPPCDIAIGHEIIDGGHATFVLRATSGASGSGEVLASTEPEAFPVGPLTARYDPNADQLHLSGPLFENFPLCSSGAEASGTCGA